MVRLKNEKIVSFYQVGVPEWSNGHGSRPCGSVPTQVQTLPPTFKKFYIESEIPNRCEKSIIYKKG